MDCNPSGSSVHGISQLRILTWVDNTSSRWSSWSRDQARVSCVSCIACRFFPTEPLKVKVKSLSHVQLCDPMDYSLPGSSVHGILQARILEWVAISFSRGSSRPRDRSRVFLIGGRHFNLWALRKLLGKPNYAVTVLKIRSVRMNSLFLP